MDSPMAPRFWLSFRLARVWRAFWLSLLRALRLRNFRFRQLRRFRSRELETDRLFLACENLALLRVDTDGQVAAWSPSARELLAYGSSEILGQPLQRLYPPGEAGRTRLHEALHHARSEGRHVEEGWRLRQGGQPFWARTITLAERDAKGRITGFAQIVQDESPERQLRKQLDLAREAAEAATRAKQTFLANLSHEIRTPLGAVLGFAELMQNPSQSNSDRADLLEKIKRNGEHLSKIINDLLDLCKVEGEAASTFESIDFNLMELLHEVSHNFRRRSLEKRLDFSVRFETPIPEHVISDPARIRRVLFNLLDNAVKFTDYGSITVNLRLARSSSFGVPARLWISVTDTGRGMNAEQRLRLFEPFTPGDSSTTRKIRGTGLGLVLSQRLARGMGGDLFLSESSIDEGSVFTLIVPVTWPEETKMVENFGMLRLSSTRPDTRPAPALPSQRPQNANGELSGLSILVVDDAPDNQFLTSRFLRLAGANVEIATSGHEAMDKARQSAFDVILMDIQMPEIDGYETTRRLRGQGFRQPIIALTARVVNDERDACLRSGFDDYISKPIDRQVLIETIRRHAGEGVGPQSPRIAP